MLLLNKQDSLEIVILFLTHYCNETKCNNLKLIINNLKKTAENIKLNSQLIDWEFYLNKAKDNINSKKQEEIASTKQSKLFTEQEVFDAMILLLEENYKNLQSDDIGGCLSDLAYCDYGETADPAMGYFWKTFLNKRIF